MPGIKSLRKLQIGKETSSGQQTSATTLWRGSGMIDDQRTLNWVNEDIGYMAGVGRVYTPKLLAGLEMEATEATFEQAPYIYEAAITTATPAQDGTGSGYIYTYTFPNTTTPVTSTYTIESGDNQQMEYLTYGFINNFTLEGVGGEAWMLESTWSGQQTSKGVYTAGVSVPNVEEMLFLKSNFYVDAIGGTIGSTLVSNTLLGATLEYTTGMIPKFTADGNLYFSFMQYAKPECVLTITFEHNGSAVTEKDNWRAETPRLIRILTQGSAFTTAGSTYTNKTHIIDLAGHWERFEPLGDQDGNDIYEATFRASYNQTASFFGSITVVNDLSALT